MPHRVLVVDDHAVIRNILTSKFTVQGSMPARLLTAREESPERKKCIQSDSCDLLAENAKRGLAFWDSQSC